MSKEVGPFKLSLVDAEASLAEFRKLLDAKAELSEKNDIRPFFAAHRSLVALAGSLNPQIHAVDRIAEELDLFGNFRCDWAIGDSSTRAFTLLEFEDARANSVFGGGQKYHEEWGRRFEHGFSQLVDWFWALDQYRGHVDLRKRFDGEPKQIFGLLVIGRRQFIDAACLERLEWRTKFVPIDNNRVICATFDDLYDFLETRIQFFRRIADHGDFG